MLKLFFLAAVAIFAVHAQTQPPAIVLHAAHLLDIETGRTLSPGEVLVRGDRIVEVGSAVTHPAGAETIDLGLQYGCEAKKCNPDLEERRQPR